MCGHETAPAVRRPSRKPAADAAQPLQPAEASELPFQLQKRHALNADAVAPPKASNLSSQGASPLREAHETAICRETSGCSSVWRVVRESGHGFDPARSEARQSLGWNGQPKCPLIVTGKKRYCFRDSSLDHCHSANGSAIAIANAEPPRQYARCYPALKHCAHTVEGTQQPGPRIIARLNPDRYEHRPRVKWSKLRWERRQRLSPYPWQACYRTILLNKRCRSMVPASPRLACAIQKDAIPRRLGLTLG